jgi:hypothetical protein
MSRAVRAEPTRLAQGAGVTLVGLDAPVAGGVHRREVRVGDNHLIAEGFKVSCRPFAFS